MDNRLSITFLSHNDNDILLHCLREFISNTNLNLPLPFDVQILVQNCSKAYIMSVEALCVYFIKTFGYKIVLHTENDNLGVSKANNFLYNVTKNSKYVLHIEDDWFLYPTQSIDKNWLIYCLKYLENNFNLSTIALRKYGTDKEKFDYGWSRHIPYLCHQYKDNFNYQDKLQSPNIEFIIDDSTNEMTSVSFTPITNFLFTFNPCIRRNEDYIKCGVYPLPEFDDKDLEIIYNKTDDGTEKKIHNNEKWGWCEALTMEKTRHLQTEYYENGIFVHFDDWIDELKNSKEGPFKNNFNNIININCHFPVLVIHKYNYNKDFTKFKHEFLRFIHLYWTDDNLFHDYFKKIDKIINDYNPRALVTIGPIGNVENALTKHLPFEYRKKWINLENIDLFNINNIEHTAFKSFDHQGKKNNPLISVITPAYESKHRIYRPYKSLLEQTYTNWEWVIIDDSKTTETWQTLTQLAESDYRIKIYKRHKNNGSIGDNKKFCANASNGQFIFELDHDDDILPHCFERLIQAAKKYPDAGFFYSDCIELYEDSYNTFHYGDYFGLGFGSYYRQWVKNHFQYVYKTHRMNPHVFRHIVGVPNHFRCWTRECYDAVNGHNPDLQVADDYDLILRSMFKFRWVHIPEVLYLQYRNQGGDNFTFHRNALIQYLVNQLRKHHENDIHKRLIELGVNDDVSNGRPGSQLDYEIDHFQYPIIDYIYKHEDQDPNNPLFSIVIPTYNRPNHLRKALDSIFNQTYKNFEILLVGDKCPVLDQFVNTYENAKDIRFKWYNLSKNGGPGGHLPRNYAIKMMSSSNWICYLDDDNTWKENHLEVFAQTIRQNPDIEYIVNSMIIEDKELIFDDLRKGRIDTSAVCHKFQLCVENGLWRDRHTDGYAHDFKFFERILKDKKGVWTKIATLNYNTEFNGQTYEQLIQF